MKETLTVTDVGAEGDGVARLSDGRVVFTPFAMTGEVIEAEVYTDDKGASRGILTGIVSSNPHRQTPPCQHFTRCGGCALQHMGSDFYQTFKRHYALEPLLRAGINLPESIAQIHIPQGTRRRANFAALPSKGKTIIGFHERKSATIRDVPDCALISEDVRRVMESLRPFIPMITGQGKKMDVLVQCAEGQSEIGLTGKIEPGWEAQQALSDALRATGASRISVRARDYDSYETLLSEKVFYKKFGDLSVELAPGAFLQPSAEGERALTDCVIRGAGDAACIADLFCGNGTFTGPLMAGRRVSAYDLAGDSIAALKKAGVDAHARNLFKNPLEVDELTSFDCVVLDPPRAGAAAQVERLSLSNVPRIIYVSCSPQSFAKDGAILQSAGYHLKDLTIVDQFVWSSHTEMVGIWER